MGDENPSKRIMKSGFQTNITCMNGTSTKRQPTTEENTSFDPRVTLDKYLPAEWHIYVLPKLKMGVLLGTCTDC